MKKYIVLFLTLIIVGAFCSCSKPYDKEPDVTTDKKVGDTTDSANDTTESANKLEINDVIFSDLGLTYEQLSEKHGNRIKAHFVYTSMIGYDLENGYGSYSWYIPDLDFGQEFEEEYEAINSLPETKVIGNSSVFVNLDEVPFPKSNDICEYIYGVSFDDLFLGVDNLNISDLSNIPGVTLDNSMYAEIYQYFITTFFYKDNYYVRVIHDDENIIDSDSYIAVSTKSLIP